MPSPSSGPITSDPSLASLLPPSFLYACSSASYQIEGAHLEDGKGLSIWDDFLKDKENGEDACDSYHLWKDDIELLKKYGCNSYRFSVGWPRVKPLGGKDDPVNEKGIEYYSNLIDALLAEGITPCVTIFHWDYPLELEKRYGGFASEKIVDDFVAYARLLFERFGDRVQNWITINEPHIFSLLNSMTWRAETFKYETDWPALARTLILCHAKTVDLYRREFQPRQKGRIGITLNVDWVEPIDDSEEAKKMAQVSLDYLVGMYADPIYLGKFPETCLKELGDKSLQFSEEEWKLVKGSSEFFGWNHYGTAYATGKRLDSSGGPRDQAFGSIEKVFEKEGKVIGVRGENGHPYTVPWGCRKLLQYIHHRYAKPNNIEIIITENGFAVENEKSLSIQEAINDPLRQEYYVSYIKEILEGVRDEGIKVGGYMAWSLLDNLEWVFGYGPRFGITVVDRQNGFKRYPKDSAWVLRDVFAHVIRKDASGGAAKVQAKAG